MEDAGGRGRACHRGSELRHYAPAIAGSWLIGAEAHRAGGDSSSSSRPSSIRAAPIAALEPEGTDEAIGQHREHQGILRCDEFVGMATTKRMPNTPPHWVAVMPAVPVRAATGWLTSSSGCACARIWTPWLKTGGVPPVESDCVRGGWRNAVPAHEQ